MTGVNLTYFICGTPRTGSTLLCHLLTSSGVAGRPESYFREPDEAMWAAHWGIDHDQPFDDPAFVRSAKAAGSTSNGVVGVRVMWGTMQRIVGKLESLATADAFSDVDLLRRGFGPRLEFVHLRRHDTIAQAVSWARAEQTGYWQPGDGVPTEPRFEYDRIDTLVGSIAEHNRSWRQWFDDVGVQPYEIGYEELSDDPVEVTRAVLDHLGLPRGGLDGAVIRDRKQADGVNGGWIARYRAGSIPSRAWSSGS